MVSVVAGSSSEVGNRSELPTTMITAIVSPTARPMPRTTLATMPDRAAGMTTRHIVCQWVAPQRQRALSVGWRHGPDGVLRDGDDVGQDHHAQARPPRPARSVLGHRGRRE